MAYVENFVQVQNFPLNGVNFNIRELARKDNKLFWNNDQTNYSICQQMVSTPLIFLDMILWYNFSMQIYANW